MNNYFDILKIPISYQINKEILLTHYLDLQSQNHPDGMSPDNDISELINRAYFVLNDDFSRMEHIIELNGINLNEFINDPDTMNDIMEKSVALDDIDIENRKNIILQIKSEIFTSLEKCYNCITVSNFQECGKYFMIAKCLKRLLQQNDL